MSENKYPCAAETSERKGRGDMSNTKRYPTRMHEVLGVETGERFKIEKLPDEFFLNHEGRMIVATAGRMFNSSGDILTYAINHGIIRKPRLSDEQVKQMQALVTLGFKWLAKQRKDCTTCLHKGKSGLSAPCLGCQGANYANWQWHGLCAENTEGGAGDETY